jgi:hypothetical protein
MKQLKNPHTKYSPKAKARKMFNEYAYTNVKYEVKNATEKAKKSAIAEVDEILSQDWLKGNEQYWNEVKAEIEKL